MIFHDNDCSPRNCQIKLCPILLDPALCCLEEENWKGSSRVSQRVCSCVACCSRLSLLIKILGHLCLLPGPDTVLQVKVIVQPLMSEKICLSAASCLSEADCSPFCQTTTHTQSQCLPPTTGFSCPINS